MSDNTNRLNFPALVVRIQDEYTLIINRGSDDGIKKGDQFLVYYQDPEELLDPETGKSLGNLEIVRGTGSAFHVQPKMTTIKSNRVVPRGRTIRRQTGVLAALGSEIIEEGERETLSFDGPKIGDKVKPV